jgi:hypothetical protein
MIHLHRLSLLNKGKHRASPPVTSLPNLVTKQQFCHIMQQGTEVIQAVTPLHHHN